VAYSLAGGLSIFLTMVLAPLGAALVSGLLVAILQAATQIQDQTLPQTVKLLVVVGVFAVMAGALFTPLATYAEDIYANFHTMVR
jgi:type III secretion protein S